LTSAQSNGFQVAEQDDRPPMVVALEWVSKITTVALEMVLPGILGTWLDHRWGTNFLTVVGFAIGLGGGIWHLLILTKTGNSKGSDRPKSEKTDKDQRL
jgi:ATP synthase protein I